ncbi:MAG TPA: hypothetical protein VFK80_08005, partial [Limnochordia bacterium]|nr:hypothetical protein [Limnochordia bacterium]
MARSTRRRIGGAIQRAVPRASCVLIAWFLLVALVNWTGLCSLLAERMAAYAQSRGAAVHYGDIRLSPAGALVLDRVVVAAAGESIRARTVAAGLAPWRAWLHGAPLAIKFAGVKGRAPAAGACWRLMACPRRASSRRQAL